MKNLLILFLLTGCAAAPIVIHIVMIPATAVGAR